MAEPVSNYSKITLNNENFWIKVIGSREYEIPTCDILDGCTKKAVITGNITKTIYNVSPDDMDTEIARLRTLERDKLSSALSLDVYNNTGAGLPDAERKTKKKEAQATIFIGDRITWNIQLAEALSQREDGLRAEALVTNDKLTDRQEACNRFKKIIQLYTLSGSDVVVEKGRITGEVTTNPTWAPADVTAFTEWKGSTLKWKVIEQPAMAEAQLGLASMILDDIGRGRSDAEITALYGYANRREALDAAINYLAGYTDVNGKHVRGAREILVEERTNEKRYYAIGKAMITEAKLRMLRRKLVLDGKIAAEDSDVAIERLLNEWLNDYKLETPRTETWTVNQRETSGIKTMDEWIIANDSITRYKRGGISDDDARTLTMIGIRHLRAMAKLEIAKLRIASTRAEVVGQAVNDCDGVISILDNIAPKGRPALSAVAAIYASNKGDYLRFDAMITKADLLRVQAGLVTGDQETAALDSALAIYNRIDDNPEGGTCPYKDIMSRAVVGRDSIKEQRELYRYADVNSDINKYFDATPAEDLLAPFYPGSYNYYEIEFVKAKRLLQRNQWVDEYLTREPDAANGGKPKEKNSKVKDAVMARYLALDIMQNVMGLYSTNRTGLTVLYYRAKLLYIQASIRLLKYEGETDRLKHLREILTDIKGLVEKLGANMTALRGINEVRFHDMDLPFYIDLYSEWASAMEQEALLTTKTLRQNEPTAASQSAIKAAFWPVTERYNEVIELCGHRLSTSNYNLHIRPIIIRLRQNNLYAMQKVNMVTRNGGTAELAELRRLSLLDKTYRASNREGAEASEPLKLETRFSEYTEGLLAEYNAAKLACIANQIFLINRQTGEKIVVDEKELKKEAVILMLYELAQKSADYAVKKLTDPSYAISTMFGVAMVTMKYRDMRKRILDLIDNYYTTYMQTGDGSRVLLTYESCIALAVCASKKRDKSIAMDVIYSLDTIIPQKEQELTAAADPAMQRDLRAQLADAYYLRANLKSWFYEESGTEADRTYLAGVSGEYQKAIDYYKEYMPTDSLRNSGFISARANKALLDYRRAKLAFKLEMRAGDTNAAANIRNAYEKIAKELSDIKDINVAGIGIELEGMTSGPNAVSFSSIEDARRRAAEFACAQVDAVKGLMAMAFSMRDMMEPGKVRVRSLRDGVMIYDAQGNLTTNTYVEMRVEVGDVINGSQKAVININRAAQTDERGNVVYRGVNAGSVDLDAENVGTLITLEQGNALLTIMGQAEINNSDGLFTTGRALYDRAVTLAGAIPVLTAAEKKDSGVDPLSLAGSYLGEVAVLSSLIPVIPGLPENAPANSSARAIGGQLSNALAELRNNGAGDEATIWVSNINGWEAMSSENLRGLQDAAIGYGNVSEGSRDAEMLKNWADVLVMIYRNSGGRTDGNRNAAITKLNEVADADKSTVGAAALSTKANIHIGREEFEDAKTSAVRALQYLTRRQCPEGQDASAFYISVVNGDTILSADRAVLEALSYLVLADAWIYTRLPAAKRVGELIPVEPGNKYGINVTGKARRGIAYCEIMGKINALTKLTAVFRDDRRMKLLVSDRSSIGLVHAKDAIGKSYGRGEGAQPSALKQIYGTDGERQYYNTGD